MSYEYAIVRFSDEIYDYVTKEKVKYTINKTPKIKWKGSWYEVELIGFNNEEICRTFVKDLNDNNPYISLERCDGIASQESCIPSPDPNLQVRIIPENYKYTALGQDILEESHATPQTSYPYSEDTSDRLQKICSMGYDTFLLPVQPEMSYSTVTIQQTNSPSFETGCNKSSIDELSHTTTYSNFVDGIETDKIPGYVLKEDLRLTQIILEGMSSTYIYELSSEIPAVEHVLPTPTIEVTSEIPAMERLFPTPTYEITSEIRAAELLPKSTVEVPSKIPATEHVFPAPTYEVTLGLPAPEHIFPMPTAGVPSEIPAAEHVFPSPTYEVTSEIPATEHAFPTPTYENTLEVPAAEHLLPVPTAEVPSEIPAAEHVFPSPTYEVTSEIPVPEHILPISTAEIASKISVPEHILPTPTAEVNETTVATDDSEFPHPNPKDDCPFNETSESGNPSLDSFMVPEEISSPAPEDYTTDESLFDEPTQEKASAVPIPGATSLTNLYYLPSSPHTPIACIPNVSSVFEDNICDECIVDDLRPSAGSASDSDSDCVPPIPNDLVPSVDSGCDSDSDFAPPTPEVIASCGTSTKCIETSKPTHDQGGTNKYYSKKKNYCIFCNKGNTNIERHFQQVHREENEVKEFATLPKNSLERRKLIAVLRQRGNFNYNSEIMRSSDTQLVVARRVSSRHIPKSEYVVCPKCKIFLTKPAFRRHYRKCNVENNGHSNRGALSVSRALFSDFHTNANEILRTNILSTMREDDIFSLIKHDTLLIVYGNAMTMKYRSRHHYDMIKNRLRIMGRFMQLLKTINSKVGDLASLYVPSMFDTIVTGLHRSGHYDNATGYYDKPTLPSTIGTALKYIGKLYIMECIKNKNDTIKKDVEDVLLLLNTGLEGCVNKTAAESLLHQKRKKKEMLPDTNDINKLQKYLSVQQKKSYKEITENGFSFDNWLRLLKLTLISILVFNRRRPGELERTFITDLKSLCYINEENNPDIFNTLSPEARQATRSYARFTIRGKLARGVPVLLSIQNHKYLDWLIEFRSAAGVSHKNPYIFGVPHTTSNSAMTFKYLKAFALLRTYSTECGAKNPSLLRATLLRKHVATKSAHINLDSSNVESLQNFLGHADKIHKDYYRQPIAYRDIVNMSKVLEIAQGGTENEDTLQSSETDENQHDADNSKTANRYNASSDESEIITPSFTEPQKRKHDSSFIANSQADDISNELEAITPSVKNVKRQRLLDIDLGYVPRRSWTTEEKETALELFGHHIDKKSLPSLKECKIANQKYIALSKRSPQQIRLWVQNQVSKKNRQAPPTASKSWTTAEKKLVQELFGQYIRPGSVKYPSTKQIQEAIDNHPELQQRTPKKIKSRIQYLRKIK